MSTCLQTSNRGNGMVEVKIAKNPTVPWIRTIRKVRDSFNKNLTLQIEATRVAVEEGLINCNDARICVTCQHWEVKNDEPLRQYGYCRADECHELREYNETCKVWESCVAPS